MDNAAFARAVRFLNYSPVAKWSAVAGGVGAAILYVALLLVLGLYADLLVNRGAISPFHELSPREQSQFLLTIAPPEDANKRQSHIDKLVEDVKDIGVTDGPALQLVSAELKPDDRRDQELRRQLLWFAELPGRLGDSVGADAAGKVRDSIKESITTLGVEAGVHRSLENLGILSLVVRSSGRLQGDITALVARYNDWTWWDGNNIYLLGLFLWALVIALVRLCLKFLSSLLAARRPSRPPPGCAGPSITTPSAWAPWRSGRWGRARRSSVFTRHLEAVHDGLYAWLTVVFREPVKFALLLIFALLVNFWLALAFCCSRCWSGSSAGRSRLTSAHRDGPPSAGLGRAARPAPGKPDADAAGEGLPDGAVQPGPRRAADDRAMPRAAATAMRGEAIYRPVLSVPGPCWPRLVLLYVAGLIVSRRPAGRRQRDRAGDGPRQPVLAAGYVGWSKRRLCARPGVGGQVLFKFLDRPGGVGQAVEAEFLPPLRQHCWSSTMSACASRAPAASCSAASR